MSGRVRALGAGVALTLAAVLAATPALVSASDSTAAPTLDPRRTRGLFVDPKMPAAQAAREDDTFAPLGKAAQALWVTDHYALADVREAVVAYARDAGRAGKTPVLAVYAIPGRDCGLYSSGGLPDGDSYKAWVREAAGGLKGRRAMVVIEPDAVAFMGDPACDAEQVAERAGLLRFAVRRLGRAGAWVYLDAGHSGWRTPHDIAPLLEASGIADARGFSTNIGNYRKTRAEMAYARAVVRELRRLGVTGKRYVIETARNGAPAESIVDGDVCNPTWARVGRTPKLVFENGAPHGPLDGFLWIKHPGESDGQSSDDTCHGGPPSGQWWPAGARRLLGLSS